MTEGQCNELYTHLKLKSPADDFRILTLHPGRWDDDIHLTLQTSSLSASPCYEALSYAWGETTAGRSVIVQGNSRLPVTDNLYRALRNLRKSSGKRNMWVDAICINQNDVEERSQQVKIMDLIYRSATCVNIWLGEYNPTVASSITSSIMSTLLAVGELMAWTNPKNIIQMMQQYSWNTDAAWDGSAPQWHQRTWTIQEFILAREAYLCIGRRRILLRAHSATDLSSKLALWNTCSKHINVLFMTALDLRMKFKLGAASLNNESACYPYLRILDMPRILADSQSTDKRDMIYSLIGLLRNDERRLIRVDYKMSYSQLYAQATFASLKSSGSFEILEYVRIHDHDGALPTWSIDFTSLPFRDIQRQTIELQHITNRSKGLFVESGVHDAFTSPLRKWETGAKTRLEELECNMTEVDLDSSLSFLSIRGARVDVVVSTAALGTKRMTGYDWNAEKRRVIPILPRAGLLVKAAFLSDLEDPGMFPLAISLLRCLAAIYSLDAARMVILPSPPWKMPAYSDHPEERLAAICDGWSKTVKPDYRDSQGVEAFCAVKHQLDCIRLYTEEVGDGTCLFMTSNGLIGFAVGCLEAGDILVLVKNPWPFIALHPVGQRFAFRGFVYLHGFMHRTFWERWSGNGLQLETFVVE